MEVGSDDWDEVFRRVSSHLVDRIQREYYMRIIGDMRNLDTASEKLIYLYLALFQPQSFSSLRRGLGLHRNTVQSTLHSLKTRGVLTRDDRFFWWIKRNKDLG